MQKNKIVTQDHKIISKKTIPSPTAKYGTENLKEDRIKSKSDRRKFKALHDALEDPITICEGS